MKNTDFLDILEQRRLVPADIARQLRDKIARDGDRITPGAILKYLVKQELVSRTTAQRLLQTTLTVSANAESSILGFVPVAEPKEHPHAEEPDDLKLVEEDDEEEAIPTLKPIQESPSAVAQVLEENLPKSDATPEETHRDKKRRKQRKKGNEWESSLILYGGGGLLLLVVAGALVYWLLNRENADEVYKQAGTYFDGGSYTQAISQYEHFVENYPKHPEFSKAKVRLGMARLWKIAGNTKDYVAALKTAKQVVDEIDDEREFDSAQRDLASLLPKIADGLAKQAEAAKDNLDLAQERVDQARQALSLCMNTRYIPKKFRDEVLLNGVEEALLRVQRNREEQLDLTDSLGKIDAALAGNDIAGAYELRGQLLEKHPVLLRDTTLADKVKEISTAEAKVVHYVAESQAATVGPRASPIVASLTPAERTVSDVAEVPGNVAVRVGGAVYGLQVKDGALLWRTFLGNDPQSPPLQLDNGDFLVLDQKHQELLRLDGTTGAAKWRLPLDSPALEPVIAGETAYVTLRAGRLVIVNVASGQRQGYVQFGQRLCTPPAVDVLARRLYLPGEHSSLYTISLEDHSCLGAYYLGHSVGSVAVPPVRVIDRILLVENTGRAASDLQVLSLGKQGAVANFETKRRLTGTVDTPLMVEARRVVVVTSLGQVTAMEVSRDAGDESLSLVANRDAEGDSSLARFALLHEGNVWIAAESIHRLAIVAAGSQIRLLNLDNDFAGDTFTHPLQHIGNLVVHVRRPARQAGSIVAATDASTGKTLWQTELAVPLAGAPSVDTGGKRIAGVAASGAAYLFDSAALARRVQDQSARPAVGRRSLPVFTSSAALGQGRVVAGELGSDSLLSYRPDVPRRPTEVLKLAGKLASEIIVWGDRYVVPTDVGQVTLFDAGTNQIVGTPFQMPLEPNKQYPWITPAVYAAGDTSQLVVSDGQYRIQLLSFESEPEPHLAAVADKPLGDAVLSTRLAVIGDLAIAGTDNDTVARFTLPALEVQTPVAIGSQVTWGPFAVGDQFLLATSTRELICLSQEGEIAWKQPLGERQPVGQPLVMGEGLYLAWQLQGVSKLDPRSGEEEAHAPLDQNLLAGPVSFAGRLVVTTDDGTLLVINAP